MNKTLAVILSLVVINLSAQAEEATYFHKEISNFSLDADTGIQPDSWSEPLKIDGKSSRTLIAGKEGQIILPIWWENTDRPVPGNNALAEIHFKDTATNPVRVNLHAGLPNDVEIHRIGGLADNKWKTAHIPIPWDQIIRIKDKQLTAITLFSDTDLSVHSIRIKKANEQIDETRWAAETRAWIARAQKDKRANAGMPPAQKPALTESTAQQQAILYARSMVNLVYPNSAPQSQDVINAIEIQLAENEMEGRQFAIYANQKNLENITLSCSPLLDNTGNELDAQLELFTVEYACASPNKGKQTLYPQRLWPQYPINISSGQSHGYWLNLETQRNKSKAGTYNGTIKILSDGKTIGSATLNITVLPIDLLTMSEAGLHLGACIPRLIPAHELHELARHNHNSINLWYTGTWSGRTLIKNGDDFDINFGPWNDFMKHAKAAGVENFVYFLGGNPYGYPDSMHLERDLYRYAYSDKTNVDEARTEWLKKAWDADGKLPDEIRDLYSKWTKKFYGHAKANNWPEPIVTPFDEPAKWTQESWARAKQYRWLKPSGSYSFRVIPNRKNKAFLEEMGKKGIEVEYLCDGGAGPWIKTHFKDCAKVIHDAWPGARVYASIHHAEAGLPFLEDSDVFCTNAIHQDLELGDKVRAVPNKTFWQYTGTNDRTPPAVPWFTCGVYFGSFGARGSLIWAYNWSSRFDTSSGGGQWAYGWTTPYSLVRTPYLEGLREGYDDRRYMETLKRIAESKNQSKKADDLLTSIFNEAKHAHNQNKDTIRDYFNQTKDPERAIKYRKQIVDLILELQKE